MSLTAHGNSFDAVSLEQLRRRRSEKWATYPADVLPVFVAEMDFPLAPAISRVMAQAISEGDLGYAYADGSRLAAQFAAFAARRWAWDVDSTSVVAAPDVMVGVAELLRGLTTTGAGVIINTPVYAPFYSVIAETGRRVVEVPLLGSNAGGRLPLDGIRAAFAAGANTLLLCNPHNPTGYVADRDELLAVAHIVNQYDAVVLSDEIHSPLVLAGAEHVPFGSLPGRAAERAITLTSASKAWNLAGLKCAMLVATSDVMRRAVAGLPANLAARAGHLGVLASESAFAEAEPWLDDLCAYLDETRRWLPRLLADRLPGVHYEPGQATYLAWLDCRELGLGPDPAKHFLQHGRVALTPGPAFGTLGRGFARLNLGTSRALIEEAVDRMARAAAIRPTGAGYSAFAPS